MDGDVGTGVVYAPPEVNLNARQPCGYKKFHPFQTSKSSGMVMGLSISRSIIQAPGGELWVDNDYPDGALLGFSLPVSE